MKIILKQSAALIALMLLAIVPSIVVASDYGEEIGEFRNKSDSKKAIVRLATDGPCYAKQVKKTGAKVYVIFKRSSTCKIFVNVWSTGAVFTSFWTSIGVQSLAHKKRIYITYRGSSIVSAWLK
jgi:hypothetical protein